MNGKHILHYVEHVLAQRLEVELTGLLEELLGLHGRTPTIISMSK
ncbi:hypothetical protein SDC9_100192 [bioreactor metagenome]|uniref:Uncharacterized protein n=1 Tax=bioreactor metagenome TaxID=1076179 RepID=A0A645AV42_9ZZZZ